MASLPYQGTLSSLPEVNTNYYNNNFKYINNYNNLYTLIYNKIYIGIYHKIYNEIYFKIYNYYSNGYNYYRYDSYYQYYNCTNIYYPKYYNIQQTYSPLQIIKKQYNNNNNNSQYRFQNLSTNIRNSAYKSKSGKLSKPLKQRGKKKQQKKKQNVKQINILSNNIKTNTKSINQNTQEIKLISWNIRGLATKLEIIQNYIERIKANICFLQETFLNKQKPTVMVGFKNYISNRKNRLGGGLAIYYEEHISLTQLETKNTKFYEAQVAELGSILLINIYRPVIKSLN